MFGLLCIAIGCSTSTPPTKGSGDSAQPIAPVNIGAMLFSPAPWPTYDEGGSATTDPIRVPMCLLTVLKKAEVPSKEEGTIEWLGTEMVAGQAVDPKDVHHLVRKKIDGSEQRIGSFQRLRVGDRVEKDQVIALLESTRAHLEHKISLANIKGAEAEQAAAGDAIVYYNENVKIEKKANSSTSAIVLAQANLAKSISEKATKDWGVERSKGEEKKALDKLDNHLIRAPFTGEIVHFSKQVGEGVKATEPILLLQNTDILGVEGFLPMQFAARVKPCADVFLEPALMAPPLPGRSPHTSSKPISAVAVGIKGEKQVIVSASEDGSVYVWERGKVYDMWKHRMPVRALACTPPGTAVSLALTGCDDGKARLWSLQSSSSEPVVVLDGHHEGGVTAAAFSPDGTKCVTADDRGEIMLWDTAKGQKLYTFPREHNSSVGSLHFTPQCRVVSTAHDNSALVWKVGEISAAVETRFDHLSGEVGVLGVSDDGGQMLLDLDKNRLRVVDLGKNYNLGTLQQSSDSGKFTTFALMSPAIGGKTGARVILTTSGTDGILQVWRWTGGAGHGAELRKLVCTGNVPPTCAAFAPIAKDGFIVAGTRKGDVHVWPMPTEEELANQYRARVTSISENSESSGKSVRIYAEYTNPPTPELRLRPGTTATVVIPQ